MSKGGGSGGMDKASDEAPPTEAVLSLKNAIEAEDLQTVHQLILSGVDLSDRDYGTNSLHDLINSRMLIMPRSKMSHLPLAPILPGNPFFVTSDTPPLTRAVLANPTFPAAATVPDHNQQLCLHLATSVHAPLPLIMSLYKAHPQSAKARDGCGFLPVHYCLHPGSSDAVLQYLIQHGGGGKEYFMFNDRKMSPLLFYVKSGTATWRGVMALLDDGGTAVADCMSGDLVETDTESYYVVSRKLLSKEKRYELLSSASAGKGGGSGSDKQDLSKVKHTIMKYVGLLDGTDDRHLDCMWQGDGDELCAACSPGSDDEDKIDETEYQREELEWRQMEAAKRAELEDAQIEEAMRASIADEQALEAKRRKLAA
ncbi:hypothetical protein TeGR_g6449 [Tetraparma gracilis]|uniref:Ankyrin repeat-containing domain protein n=1 Tax=Tetraparma gracilis TaxID=2962635 RepID=A0ABQ6MAM2_9STRA|nr:hypothetical protein TeGR_g6449 [Tetraparma gracilis]